MKRAKKVGISVSLLLACVSGITCGLLINVWVWGRLTIQEPRFPILVAETIGLGLTAVFGIFCLVYFWRVL